MKVSFQISVLSFQIKNAGNSECHCEERSDEAISSNSTQREFTKKEKL